MNMILGDDDESSDENDENEVDNYLKMKSNRKIMPLIWWENNKTKFPFLSQLAKEYLGITATSVPSERLFSAVGNVISSKRSNLKPVKVEKMIFLKRNANLLQIY